MSIKVRTLADGSRELQISSRQAAPDIVTRYIDESCDAIGVMLFAAGSALPDVDFVRDLPGLRSIRLNGDIEDVDAVFDVPTLRRLDLMHCRSSSAVRFDALPGLESVDFAWGAPGGESIEALPALRALYLTEWAGGRLPLGKHAALQRLRLEAEPRTVVRLADLAGVAGVVEELEVDSATLTSDDPGPVFSRLRFLTLESCRLPSLDFLVGASELRELALENCGPVPSLAVLAALPNVRSLIINGSTHIVDGDLDVLDGMPLLREVALERGRPNYTTTPAEIRKRFPPAG